MLRRILAAVAILIVAFGPPLVAWHYEEIKRLVWRLQNAHITIRRSTDRKRQ